MKRRILTIFLVVVLLGLAGIVYGQTTKLDSAKAEITKLLLLKKGADIVEITNENTVHNFDGYPTGISVFDDRIEIQFKTEKTSIIFSDILDYKIKVIWLHSKNNDGPAAA